MSAHPCLGHRHVRTLAGPFAGVHSTAEGLRGASMVGARDLAARITVDI
jgi:hypothetical protein